MRPGAAARFAAALALLLSTAVSAGAQATAAPAPALSAFQRDKAATLLRDRLSCLGCHSIGDEGGVIAPDLSRATAARTPALVLRMIQEGGTNMPPYPMRETDARLIASYVASLDDAPSPARAAALPLPGGSQDDYARFCASCHGADGNGDGPNARFLPVPPAVHSSSREMMLRTDDRLYDAIAAGGATLGRSPRMPAFAGLLSDERIRALVRHIRALCKCEGPAWSRDGSRP